MIFLYIDIFPYNRQIIIPVQEEIYFKVLRLLNKIKSNREFGTIKIPEFGFKGIELRYMGIIRIYSYEQYIFYNYDNITQLYMDPMKRINSLFLQIAFRNYRRELNYFFDVRKFNQKINKNI